MTGTYTVITDGKFHGTLHFINSFLLRLTSKTRFKFLSNWCNFYHQVLSKFLANFCLHENCNTFPFIKSLIVKCFINLWMLIKAKHQLQVTLVTYNTGFFSFLTLQCLVSTKRSHILKQTTFMRSFSRHQALKG